MGLAPGSRALALTPLEQDFLQTELDASDLGMQPTQQADASQPTSHPQDCALNLIPDVKSQQAQPVPRAAGSACNQARPAPPTADSNRNPQGNEQLPGSCVAQMQAVERLEQQLAVSLAGGSGSTGSDGGVCEAASQLCRQYNRAAMRLVDSGHTKEALRLLEKAQVLCEEEGVLSQQSGLRQGLLAVTLNNLGVYYQRLGATHSALKALKEAAGIEDQVLAATQHPTPGNPSPNRHEHHSRAQAVGLPDHIIPSKVGQSSPRLADAGSSTRALDANPGVEAVVEAPASTKLNLCTVLSGAGRHKEALECVCLALGQLCEGLGFTEGHVLAWARGQGFTRSNPDYNPSLDVRTCPDAHVAWAQGAGVQTPPETGQAGGSRDEITHEASCDESSQRGLAHAPLGSVLQQLPSSSTSVLAMCLYNKAVQLEHLARDEEALELYYAAAGLATKGLGRASNLGSLFSKSLQAYKSKLRRFGPHMRQQPRAPSACALRPTSRGPVDAHSPFGLRPHTSAGSSRHPLTNGKGNREQLKTSNSTREQCTSELHSLTRDVAGGADDLGSRTIDKHASSALNTSRPSHHATTRSQIASDQLSAPPSPHSSVAASDKAPTRPSSTSLLHSSPYSTTAQRPRSQVQDKPTSDLQLWRHSPGVWASGPPTGREAQNARDTIMHLRRKQSSDTNGQRVVPTDLASGHPLALHGSSASARASLHPSTSKQNACRGLPPRPASQGTACSTETAKDARSATHASATQRLPQANSPTQQPVQRLVPTTHVPRKSRSTLHCNATTASTLMASKLPNSATKLDANAPPTCDNGQSDSVPMQESGSDARVVRSPELGVEVLSHKQRLSALQGALVPKKNGIVF